MSHLADSPLGPRQATQLCHCYPLQMAGRVSIVSFDDQGHEWYCVTDGRSVFEAVPNAVRFFADPYWRGPKPDSQAVFKVALAGDDRT